MTLRLRGFLIRRTYVGSEAMPTFKLASIDGKNIYCPIWICYMSFINDCVCQVVSAGICLVALAVTWLSEMKPTERLAVSQSDGGGVDHKVNDTWAGAHLVWVVNLLPGQHVVFIGATCCRVDPSVSGAKAGTANPPPPRIWRPAQQSPLDPISALIVVFFPPFLCGSVADLVAVMSSASNML